MTNIQPNKLAIEYLAIACIKPNPKNPRKHSKKQIGQICKSVQEFGFVAPVIVDQNNQLIAGHGRLRAAQQLGQDQVPVVRVEHLTDAQIRAYMIADNKLTENSTWDDVLLAEHFMALSTENIEFGMDITGFELPEIELMLETLEPQPQNDPDDDMPDEDLPQVTKPGDIWRLGKHLVACGDSLDEGAVAQLMGADKAAIVFVDPPYNVAINGHVGGLGAVKHREFAMASGEMSSRQFTTFLERALANLVRFSTDGSIHYVCMDWRHIDELREASRSVYSELKNICVWAKDNGGMGTFYRSRHELVFVFKNGTAPHKNNFELGQYGRYRTNVWEYSGVNSFARNSEEGDLLKLHPTCKPVALVADALKDCSDRGDLVLDTFLGSGTTLIAAERTHRICRGIDIDPRYIDTAIRRWQKLTGKTATHFVTNEPYGE